MMHSHSLFHLIIFHQKCKIHQSNVSNHNLRASCVAKSRGSLSYLNCYHVAGESNHTNLWNFWRFSQMKQGIFWGLVSYNDLHHFITWVSIGFFGISPMTAVVLRKKKVVVSNIFSFHPDPRGRFPFWHICFKWVGSTTNWKINQPW